MTKTPAVLVAVLLFACGGPDYRPIDLAALAGPDGTTDVGDHVSTEGYLLRFKLSDELMICMHPGDLNGCVRISSDSAPTDEGVSWRDKRQFEFSSDLVSVKARIQTPREFGTRFALAIESWEKVDQ
jgi:hypothetical protein